MDSISDKVKKIRVEYEDKPLNLEDLNQDPLKQFSTWFQIAIDAEVNEANAMAISTITQEGTPRSRYVLFKDIGKYSAGAWSLTNSIQKSMGQTLDALDTEHSAMYAGD